MGEDAVRDQLTRVVKGKLSPQESARYERAQEIARVKARLQVLEEEEARAAQAQNRAQRSTPTKSAPTRGREEPVEDTAAVQAAQEAMAQDLAEWSAPSEGGSSME